MQTQESVAGKVHNARHMLLQGNRAAALASIEDANATGFATYHIVRAECLYAEHKYGESKIQCDAALVLSPNSPRAAILLELIDEMLTLDKWVQPERKLVERKADDAQLEFPRMERLEPPVPSESELIDNDKPGLVSETLAMILAKQGKYAEARKIYIQLSRLHPDRDAYYHDRIVEMEQWM